jgi:cysteine synthase A
MPDSSTKKDWLHEAILRIEADFCRSVDTHLIPLPIPTYSAHGIDLYLKDESTHPTGSLKHRLARSLFLYALCNNWLCKGKTVIEASSGSTAISEAYFASLIGLPFIAVMPKTTSSEKIERVEFYGGRCHLVDSSIEMYKSAQELAIQTGGHYMDQFTYAERATDWRGNNNIAQSIYTQMSLERSPIPKWILMGAGTGGTCATIGRYIRYQRHESQICVADPEGSVFLDYFETHNPNLSSNGSRIEGIGRPRPEASFIPSLIDRMIRVNDVDSIAAMRILSNILGRKVGPSTGTNFIAMLKLANELKQKNIRGSILSLLCDSGDRYLNTYHDENWANEQFGDCSSATKTLNQLMQAN